MASRGAHRGGLAPRGGGRVSAVRGGESKQYRGRWIRGSRSGGNQVARVVVPQRRQQQQQPSIKDGMWRHQRKSKSSSIPFEEEGGEGEEEREESEEEIQWCSSKGWEWVGEQQAVE
ncbi:unnamed protein product, partial [Discosporangium mesarthrocarpum]